MNRDQIASNRQRNENRVLELESALDRLRVLEDYTRSRTFADALGGRGGHLEPAYSREEFLRRWKDSSAAAQARVDELVAEASDLPGGHIGPWHKRRALRIGIVADPFLYASLECAATLVPVTPVGFASELEGVDLLLITSAWNGLAGEWKGLPLANSEARSVLVDKVVPHARAAGIPVIFYSKEDPPSFTKFIGMARAADAVFTTAVECVEKYTRECGDEVPVDVLPFAVNPAVHSPLGSGRYTGHEILFAGSWFRHKYAERRRAGVEIFDGVMRSTFELLIADRNLLLDPAATSSPERYLFPEQYIDRIVRPIRHDDLMRLQRLLPVAVNLNSVVNSQSMFANRVVELQAMGTFIVSNYNAGVNSLYPHVRMPDTALDMQQTLDCLKIEEIRRAQVEGLRAVFTSDTAFERIDRIARSVDLEATSLTPRVRFVDLAGMNGSTGAREGYGSGTASGLPPLSAVDSGRPVDTATVIVDEGLASAGDAVCDLVNAFKYADVDAVRALPLATRTTPYELESIESGAQGPEQFTAYWVPAGRSPNEAVRDAENRIAVLSDDLPQRTGGEAITLSAAPWPRLDAELSVIVPVYNNGAHLRNKCFESLRRSSVFDQAEIILVDDGSTDSVTLAVLEDLERSYANVRCHRFPRGGSGSASRPRNMGLYLARTPFVTYLDPDNEQTEDGFSRLMEIMRSSELDFAIGNMVRFKEKRVLVNNVRVLAPIVSEDGLIPPNALEAISFQPMSIQALVARTDWLKSLGLTQPVGAVGQDSYFFQQMLYGARRIGLLDQPVHTYYAATANSTVNSIGPRFFQKYLPLERARVAWLHESSLFDAYCELRLEKFFCGWFLKKLSLVSGRERPECEEIIRELAALYAPHEWHDERMIALVGDAR